MRMTKNNKITRACCAGAKFIDKPDWIAQFGRQLERHFGLRNAILDFSTALDRTASDCRALAGTRSRHGRKPSTDRSSMTRAHFLNRGTRPQNRPLLISRIVAAFLAALMLYIGSAAYAAQDSSKHFDIKTKPLADALMEFGVQSGLTVVAPTTLTAGKKAATVRGDLAPTDALARLLKGSGLTFAHVSEGTIAIQAGASTGPVQASAGEPGLDKDLTDKLDEVVVTGTHIRGGTAPTSRVLTFTRDDIDRSGASTVKDFVETLPENFGGFANEMTHSSISGGVAAGQNLSDGTAANLRGLGPGATLVLVDGHRLAQGNIEGNWTDISLIPLSAVERVEILLDGASAIYGADAVAGVINFIMRKHFDGAETRASLGYATSGGDREIQAAQTFGKEWSGGSAVLTYEYFDRTAVNSSDRDFTATALTPNTLLPEQTRHSLFATVEQQVSPGLVLSGEGSYARRASTDAYTTAFDYGAISHPTIDAVSGVVSAEASLGSDTTLLASGLYTRSNLDVDVGFFAQPDISLEQIGKSSTSTSSFDLQIDGHLGEGVHSLGYALGGQYRRETFSAPSGGIVSPISTERNIYSEFLEVKLPLVGPGASGGNRLTLSAAVRSEHYSDFGITTNPKVGLIWKPYSSLKFNATFGTSFQAPVLYDLNSHPDGVTITPETDAAGHIVNTLIPFGGNVDLKPEKATTWSAGINWSVDEDSAFLSYYNIRFKDQITNLDSLGYDTFDALKSASTFGPSLVQLNPSKALLQQLISTASEISDESGIPGGATLADIGALVDGRQLNLSTLTTTGLDFGGSHAIRSRIGKWTVGLTGTYILKYDEQLLPGSALMSVLNTPFNPVDLRLRGNVGFSLGGLSVTSFLNYVHEYHDPRSGTNVPVASWTTVDLNLAYRFPQGAGVMSNSQISLTATNLGNASPPFVPGQNASVFPGISFDGTNANPLGRVVGLHLSKHWR
jgi:iron complex outermembrane receptor protein